MAQIYDYQAELNPQMAAIWGERLRGLGFKPMDYNGVGYWSADGVYYAFANDPGTTDYRRDDIQLVVIGPMRHTPYEYAMMLKASGSASYWVKDIGTIPPNQTSPEALKVIIRERGIWFIQLRSYEAENRPVFGPNFQIVETEKAA